MIFRLVPKAFFATLIYGILLYGLQILTLTAFGLQIRKSELVLKNNRCSNSLKG